MVLPKKYHKRVYGELHENMGHLGAERVTELAKERFYWPFMRADITHYVTKVCHCLKQRKPPTHVYAPLLCGRQRGRVVRAPDLKSGGHGFKSRSDHLAGVVSRWTPVQLLGHACK